MRIVLKIAVLFIIIAILLFDNCTTKYANPYSAGSVAGNLGKRYATEIEVVEIKKNKASDGKKYNEYLLKDKRRNFLFEAGSYIKMDRHIISYSRERWDQYARDLMRHHHDDVLQIAAKYGVRLIPPRQELPEVGMKAFSTVPPHDSVFIHSPEQLDTVAGLYLELARFYRFTYIRPHKNESKNPKLILAYLPENETDRSKSIKFCRLLYLKYRVEPGQSPREKAAYVTYIPDHGEVRRKIDLSWNDAVGKGKIIPENAAR
jgi:hypothetical protein